MKKSPVKSGNTKDPEPPGDDSITVLEGEARSEMRIKASRFIGMARCTPTLEESQAWVRRAAGEYHDASHVCFAFRLGTGDASLWRANDSGEPPGTAGKPILQAIDRHGLSDVTCIVVRYFGGIKLGTGGLAQAYGECADRALASGKKVKKYVTAELCADFDYDQTGKVMSVIGRLGAEVTSAEYGSGTRLILKVRRSLACTLRQQLCDALSGNIKITERREQP